MLFCYTPAVKTKFKRTYTIVIEGESTLVGKDTQTLLETSFERIMQDNIISLEKILPFPSEKLKIKIKGLHYKDFDK